MSSGNGAERLSDQPGAQPENVATLELTMVMSTGAMQLNFKGPTLDVALNMLAQAARELEGQWRQARALQLQQILREQAEAQRVAEYVKGRR